MIYQIGDTITFYAQFVASKLGSAGLTVTMKACYKNGSAIGALTDAAWTEVGNGLYRYALDGATYVDAAGQYVAIATTANTDVDQRDLAAIAVVTPWVAHVDTDLSDLATTNSVDRVLDDTTEIQAALTTIDGNVDSILADTGTDGVVVAAASIASIQSGLATPGDAMTLTAAYDAAKTAAAAGAQMDRVNAPNATAVAAVKIGATDYPSKPADATDITNALLARGEALPPPPENPMSADRVRWEHIQRVYELCDRNVSETARRLNMHRRTLQRILAKRSPR